MAIQLKDKGMKLAGIDVPAFTILTGLAPGVEAALVQGGNATALMQAPGLTPAFFSFDGVTQKLLKPDGTEFVGGGGQAISSPYTLAQLELWESAGTTSAPAPTGLPRDYTASDAATDDDRARSWRAFTATLCRETTVLPPTKRLSFLAAAVSNAAATQLAGAAGINVAGWQFATIWVKNTSAAALQLFQLGFRPVGTEPFEATHGVGGYLDTAGKVLNDGVLQWLQGGDPNVLPAASTVTLFVKIEGRSFMDLSARLSGGAPGTLDLLVDLSRGA